MNKLQEKEIQTEAPVEEPQNKLYSFIVGMFIALAIIIVFVILSLVM